MDQDIVSNKPAKGRGRSRGRYRGDFRGRGAFRQANDEDRNFSAANQLRDRLIDASTPQDRNDPIHFQKPQQDNVEFQGYANRGYHRGGHRDRTNTATRGHDIYRGLYTNAANMDFHQAQTFQPMSITTPHNQFLAEDSWPTLSPITRHSTQSVSEHSHPGFFPTQPEYVHPIDTEIPIEQFERMSFNSNPEPSQYALTGQDPSYGYFPTPQSFSGSTSNIHPSYHPTSFQLANQEIAQSISQVPPNISTSTIQSPSISALGSMDFKAGQSFQSSPLSYLCAHSMPSGLSDLQSLTKNLTESVYSILSSPLGLMYVSILDGLSVPQRDLEEHGYRTKDLTKQELEDKQRCFGCGKLWSKIRKSQEYQQLIARKVKAPTTISGFQSGEQNLSLQSRDIAQIPSMTSGQETESRELKPPKPKETKPVLHCHFHSGTIIKSSNHTLKNQTPRSEQNPGYHKFWSCCNKPPSAEPCSGSEHHELREVNTKTLASQWQIYPTPRTISVKTASYRVAVALDCEMGISKAGDPELIRVTLIDYFTTETLIDKLVFPEVPMQHLNTKYSGVTWSMLNAAAAKRQCFRGRAAVLKEVWRFVGPETIVIAHSGYNDLSSLRWRHLKIVDTYLIDAIPERDRLRELKKLEEEQKVAEGKKVHKSNIVENETVKSTELSDQGYSNQKHSAGADNSNDPKAEEKQDGVRKVKGRGPFSLKTLAKSRLDRDIQVGSNGHDSLEDALATRDLAHWHVRRIMEGIGKDEGDSNTAGQASV